MQRKKHSAEFKAKIALEAAKGLKTINEIASEAEVHPTQYQYSASKSFKLLPVFYDLDIRKVKSMKLVRIKRTYATANWNISN